MKFLISTSCLLVSSVVFAQSDLQPVKYEGFSETATSKTEAVREITAQATEATARNQVVELIGEAKYRKHKDLIEKRIISQSSKFIPYISPGQATQTNKGYKVVVQLKVSPESLKKMVQSAGLLADTETPGTFVSLVTFPENETALRSLWIQAVSADMVKKGFKAVNGQAQMELRGEFQTRTADDGSGTVAIKVGVYQVNDSRLIADVTRTAKLAKMNEAALKNSATQLFKDVSKELTATVYEAWQTGIIGSSAVQIAAVGALTPKQLEDFKTELNRMLRDLKNLRERRFSAGKVVLEADFKGSLSSLSDRLRQAQLPSFQTEVGTIENNVIELRVKARR